LDHLYFELKRFCADTAFPGHPFICQGGRSPNFQAQGGKNWFLRFNFLYIFSPPPKLFSSITMTSVPALPWVSQLCCLTSGSSNFQIVFQDTQNTKICFLAWAGVLTAAFATHYMGTILLDWLY